MTEWLISIVGVVAIGVLLDILLPSGEINKYIKGVFGIVVVFVIIIPLPKLIKGDFLNFFDKADGIEIDADYYNESLERRNDEREKALLKYLSVDANVRSVRIEFKRGDYDDITAVRVRIGADSDAASIRKKTSEYLKVKADKISVESG